MQVSLAKSFTVQSSVACKSVYSLLYIPLFV
jgi:hypothetical protein